MDRVYVPAPGLLGDDPQRYGQVVDDKEFPLDKGDAIRTVDDFS
jgi:hypothetical protein